MRVEVSEAITLDPSEPDLRRTFGGGEGRNREGRKALLLGKDGKKGDEVVWKLVK